MISLKHALRVIAEYRGIDPAAISGSSMLGHVVAARQEFCWIARRHTDMSYQAIGRLIGHRDPSTVRGAVRVVAARAAGNLDYDEDLDRLERLITGDPPKTQPSAVDIARRVLWSEDASSDSRRMAAAITAVASFLDLPGLSAEKARSAALSALTRGDGADLTDPEAVAQASVFDRGTGGGAYV